MCLLSLSARLLHARLQDCYALLHQHGISTSHELVERVDTLRYMWQKLQQLVVEVQDILLQIQPKFRDTLVESVSVFQETLGTFVGDYSMVSDCCHCSFLCSDHTLLHTGRADGGWHTSTRCKRPVGGVPVPF